MTMTFRLTQLMRMMVTDTPHSAFHEMNAVKCKEVSIYTYKLGIQSTIQTIVLANDFNHHLS